MFLQALRVALGLALFKGGPADMPFSPALTRMAFAMAVVSSLLLLSPVTPLPLALATGVGVAVGMAFFTRQLLRAKKLENRHAQTLAAQLMVGSLFALALWPAFVAMAPAMLEMMATMRASIAAAGPDGDAMAASVRAAESLQIKPPAWAALWSDVLFVWILVASIRINRLAADLSMPSSWLLTFLGLFVMVGFVLVAQLVAAIFVG